MAAPLTLQIQRLGGFNQQTLILLHVAQLRADGAASGSSVRDLYKHFRLPPPTNVNQHLKWLSERGFAMQPAASLWSVTPLGDEEIRRLMGNASLTTLATDDDKSEPSFGGAAHHLLPPELAPAQFQEGISRFLSGHPFDRNVFYMSRFPSSSTDPVGLVIDACRASCASASLEMHVASDRTVSDLLFGNVAAGMWASHYGIVVFEDRLKNGLNYNAVLEAGAMLATGRRCLILKDIFSPSLPTNLVGHIYNSVDITDVDAVKSAVASWVQNDLALT